MNQQRLRTVEEHQRVVANLVRPRRPEPTGLDVAAGRVLAADVIAPVALPPFDNSAMDGYAVRVADLNPIPIELPVAQDIPAGRTDVPALKPGTAHRIMTGAPMPQGADTIIPVEATDGGTATVSINERADLGKHVRTTGSDVTRGEVVLKAGAFIGPAQLGLLASLGLTAVETKAPLRVAVLSTGTELVEPGQPLKPGQIYESNSLMLATAVRAAGGEAHTVHFVRDDVEQFRTTFARLNEYDLVLTTGGVSAGAYEVVKDALDGHGVEFAKVAMQPGMPQGAGTYQGIPVVTLPGNPVSAMVSFEVFLRPAIRAAMGLNSQRRRVVAELTDSIEAPPQKRQFRRGHLNHATGTVGPAGPAGSQFLRWLANANCLIDIPEDVTKLEHSESVTTWVLDD